MGAPPGTLGNGGEAFTSTCWSVVLECAHDECSRDDADRSRIALETLCRDYWPPLYSYVRRRGHPSAEAQDLVQGFFVHLLETRAYAKADPERGKFRTFLLASLKNFLANAHDHAVRHKRGGDASFVPLDEHLVEAEAAALAADERAAFGADLVAQERIVQDQPEDSPVVSVLGLIDAGLGRKEEALREGRRAVELLPTAKNSIRGPYMVLQLAMIAAWAGETDLAIEQLHLTRKLLPVGPHYGYLKLDPVWDPLRDDPRFAEIVASLAPKDAR